MSTRPAIKPSLEVSCYSLPLPYEHKQMTSTGKQNSCQCQLTEELSVRIVAPQASSWLQSYGTFDGGGELMTRAWQGLEHRLAI